MVNEFAVETYLICENVKELILRCAKSSNSITQLTLSNMEKPNEKYYSKINRLKELLRKDIKELHQSNDVIVSGDKSNNFYNENEKKNMIFYHIISLRLFHEPVRFAADKRKIIKDVITSCS